MAHYSDYGRIFSGMRSSAEHKAEDKLERIKQESKEVGHRALFLGSAAATGALYGVLNTQKGGSALNPYSIAGKAPLDTVLAAGGVVAALLVRKSKFIYPALGAAASAVGICAARYGSNFEANRMQAGSGAASTTSASTTTQASAQGLVGHGMRSRQFGPGIAQRRHAAHAYVNANAR
jgi:hypothetical protein